MDNPGGIRLQSTARQKPFITAASDGSEQANGLLSSQDWRDARLADMSADPSPLMIDATCLKAHRTALSFLLKMEGEIPDRTNQRRLNSKLHAQTYQNGKPLRFALRAGQLSDYTGAAALHCCFTDACFLLADRGSAIDGFRYVFRDKDIITFIPDRSSRDSPVRYDKRHYLRRGRIEVMFGRLKDWSRMVNRHDRCSKVLLHDIILGAPVRFW